MNTVERCGLSALSAVLASALAGCGMPGAPQAPSLNLPERVADLSATRTGNRVELLFTMPGKNTDKLLLKGAYLARACRREGASAPCAPVGSLELAPGKAGVFADNLPPLLATGAPRALSYSVEIVNRSGRSAGLSKPALILAGEAPVPLTGLTAEVRKDGMLLRWQTLPNLNEAPGTAVRIHRKLLKSAAAMPLRQDPLAPMPETAEQDLLVEPGSPSGRALDPGVRFRQAYEYRAQRVDRVIVDGQIMELAGELSPPLRVETTDIFPPDVPAGLVAVANASGAELSVDLSWQPDPYVDLTGYAVYRREATEPWQRVSSAQPVMGPAFRDAHVLPGHTYSYSVTAIDEGGHESARSTEAQETVPAP